MSSGEETDLIGISGKFYKVTDLSEEEKGLVADFKKIEDELTRLKSDQERLALQDSIMRVSINVLVAKISDATSKLTEVPAPKQTEQPHEDV